jgi:protein TonB
MRERARNSSQLAGLSTAVLMTTLVGYALANGIGGNIARMIEQPMTFTPIAEDDPPVDQDPFEVLLPNDTTRLPVPTPLGPDEVFNTEDGGIFGTTETGGRVGTETAGGGGIGVASTPVRTRPVLFTRNPPPYPAADVRKQNAGITGLDVCVDAGGRVTSAVVSSSSGHASLDNAALKWVRSARFTPGKIDGVAQPVCGHNVVYEWKLENAR